MKILCLGDSLTYGYGIHPYDASLAWPALLSGKDKAINAGVPGMALLSGNGYWNSSEYLHALKARPDAIIFWLGENDSVEDLWDEQAFRHGYSLMVEELLEHAARGSLLLIRPLFPVAEIKKPVYDFGVRIQALKKIDGIILEAADAFGLGCFDPNLCLQNHKECFSDDVHPDAEGNRILAKAMKKQLQAMGWLG